MKSSNTSPSVVITPEELLEHWQGHRRVTRKTIEAFPEDKLFTYSVGGMRTFSELALEMVGMALPGMRGAVTGVWKIKEGDPDHQANPPKTKQALLALWDHVTQHINTLWPQIPAGRFQEVERAFDLYDGTIHFTIFYFIDNEIHHRGQGFVYLRSLGIEPPAFWDRG